MNCYFVKNLGAGFIPGIQEFSISKGEQLFSCLLTMMLQGKYGEVFKIHAEKQQSIRKEP